MELEEIRRGNGIIAIYDFIQNEPEWFANKIHWLLEDKYLIGLGYHNDYGRLMPVVQNIEEKLKINVFGRVKNPITIESIYDAVVEILSDRLASVPIELTKTTEL